MSRRFTIWAAVLAIAACAQVPPAVSRAAAEEVEAIQDAPAAEYGFGALADLGAIYVAPPGALTLSITRKAVSKRSGVTSHSM